MVTVLLCGDGMTGRGDFIDDCGEELGSRLALADDGALALHPGGR
jgi:hypothetical protein